MATKIAIVGRSNTGKTTLLRTITKGVYGEIADRGGVTPEADPVDYPALHATLIDTPGFQNPGEVLARLRKDITLLESLEEPEFSHEKRALRALQEADVGIYLATIENVPLSADRKEIDLIRLANPSIVGVINRAAGPLTLIKRSRIALWTDFMKASGIGMVFEFDAHWDRYSKLDKIFAAIAELLPGNKREVFKNNLAALKSSLADAQKRIAERATGCMLACRSISFTRDIEADGFDRSATEKDLRPRVQQALNEYLFDFEKHVRLAYQIAVSIDHSNVTFDARGSVRQGDRMNEMARHGAVGGVLGGMLGFAIGVLLGPVGWGVIAATATVAAATGTLGGGATGVAVGALKKLNYTVTLQLSENALREISVVCLATVWCATRHGYGHGDTASPESYNRALEFIKGEIGGTGHPDWKNRNEDRMTDWFLERLKLLDV